MSNKKRYVRFSVVLAWLVILLVILGCGTGLPELRPRFFESPRKIENHGRFVEKHYQRANGPRTINYIILEVNGSPLRIPDGFIEQTKYCEVDGIEAVALQVRGTLESAGFYIVQLDGDQQIFERLCKYKMFMGSWEGAIFEECDTFWDAENRRRISR